jgi:hypothetical protein
LITLPTEKSTGALKSPRKVVIYSAPKVGKTTLISALDNCLLVDLEDGSDFVDAMKIKVSQYQELNELCEQIIAAGKPYKYIALDTSTGLEQMVLPLALKMYQLTPMGATYKGSVLALPNGAGYLYLREAFEMMLNKVAAACDRLILLAHIKDKMIGKEGKELSAKDIDLTGKLKQIVCAGSDAIGYLYREDNKNIITFQTTDEIVCGARPLHLRNKAFTLSEQDEKGNTRVYWDKIYID